MKLDSTGRTGRANLRSVLFLVSVWGVLLGAAGPQVVQEDAVSESAQPVPAAEPRLTPIALPVEDQAAAEVLDVVEPAPPTLRARLEAVVAAQPAGTPLVVNDTVLSRVRTLVGSPTARRNMRTVLARADKYASVVQRALHEAGLPPALGAVPILESGYVSAWDGGSRHGLWMFEEPTARAYGLHVGGGADDRLNPMKETAAAVHLFCDLRARLGDWPLVLAAYNQGSGSVDAAMKRGGTQDPWKLIERGELKDYAARAIAAGFVMTDRELAAD